MLTSVLNAYRGSNVLVLGIPTGGAPVAVAVMSKLTLLWYTEAGYGA